jgi:outer membrane protein assembly factor BamB
MSVNTSAMAFLSGLILSGAAVGADWPHWRGPELTGISKETGFSTNWSAEPKVLWRAKVGQGYSSISVVEGRAYTMGWDGGKDHVRCLDAVSGKELWVHSYPCPKFDRYHPGGTGSTPTVHDGRVYTLSKQGDFFCLDASSGQVIWRKDLVTDLGGPAIPTWGFSGSPVVHGRAILVDVGIVAAFDSKTGQELWRSENRLAGYSTPMPFKRDGKELIAAFHSPGLIVLDATSGKTVATYPWLTKPDVNASIPIVAGAGELIFISSGYGRGATLVRLRDGTIEKVWENTEMKNHMNPSVLIGGQLYGFDGNNGRPDTQLACIDLETGNVRWKQGGLGCGALMAAGDKLVIFSEKGELVIAQASPESYKELARGQILGSISWTAPVLANGRIYCRNDKGDVACVDVSGQ